VWNTHLKKKLVVKKSESSGDESKLESSITSSSSSESFLSNEVPMKESEKQVSNNELVIINEDPKGSSSNSLSSSIESNILNSSQIVNNDNLEQELASLGFYDVDNILDDPNNLIEIPWESDYDLWNFIDNIGTYQSNVGEDTVQDVVEAKNWSSHDEFENEFGVVGETKESNNKDEVLPKNYEVEQEIDPHEAFDFNDIIMPDSELDFGNIQLWPSLPQNGIPKV
jgi:transcription factor MYB, plant